MEPIEVTRRGFVGSALAAAFLSGTRQQSRLTASQDANRFNLYWGDLHNHNAVAAGTVAPSHPCRDRYPICRVFAPK